MEPWKVLLLVAALPAAASLVLSGMNRGQLLQTIDNRTAAEQRVERTSNQLEQTKGELADTKQRTQTTEENTEQTRNQLVATRAEISDTEVRIQTMNREITEAENEIARFEELQRVVGEIEEVERKIALERSNISSLESDLNSAENRLAVNEAKKADSDAIIERKEAVVKFRNAGQMWKDINTTVRAAYNNWGFVVLNAGDSDGLVSAAVLDVVRDGVPIAKVLVTEVEPNQSVADIVADSVVPGYAIQPGDRAVKEATVSLP